MTTTIEAPGAEHVRHHLNSQRRAGAYPDELRAVLSAESCREAQREIATWPGYQATPLHRLSGLARRLGVAEVFYKDEGGRFGLGSFKALGGAYQVLCLLRREVGRRLGRAVSFAEIKSGEHRALTEAVTVVTATDGNHGRSVAWGAQMFGCPARIYIHAEVSRGRQEAMEAFGARVIRIDGNYDESVHQAAAEAEANGWFVVSDTSYEGYMELPRAVMEGYSVMAEEILAQLPDGAPPSHVFVQGGVGGIAGMVCGYFWDRLNERRPRFAVVEPDRAACLLESALAGRPTAIQIAEETVMAGLSCGEVSLLAWPILAAGADHFMALPDELVAPMMRLLAAGADGDPPVVAGESAVAGLAALVAARQSTDLSRILGLDDQSRVLLIGTEGATDPGIYREIVGRAPEEVARP